MSRRTRKSLVGKAIENVEIQEREYDCQELAWQLRREWRAAKRDQQLDEPPSSSEPSLFRHVG
jgi:hypothetical protein